jgi:hypothetical protein
MQFRTDFFRDGSFVETDFLIPPWDNLKVLEKKDDNTQSDPILLSPVLEDRATISTRDLATTINWGNYYLQRIHHLLHKKNEMHDLWFTNLRQSFVDQNKNLTVILNKVNDIGIGLNTVSQQCSDSKEFQLRIDHNCLQDKRSIKATNDRISSVIKKLDDIDNEKKMPSSFFCKPFLSAILSAF